MAAEVASSLPPWRQLMHLTLRELGIPLRSSRTSKLLPTFDSRAAPSSRSPASGLEQPPALHDYAARLWDYWEKEMDPDLSRDAGTLEAAAQGNVS